VPAGWTAGGRTCRKGVRTRRVTHHTSDPAGRPTYLLAHLALPHPNHSPAGFDQFLVHPLVPLPVRLDLRRPPVRVGTPKPGRSVLRTSVPKAPVDEHRDAWARKREVRPAPVEQGSPQAISKAESVHGAAQRDLGCGVPCAAAPQVASLGRSHPGSCLSATRRPGAFIAVVRHRTPSLTVGKSASGSSPRRVTAPNPRPRSRPCRLPCRELKPRPATASFAPRTRPATVAPTGPGAACHWRVPPAHDGCGDPIDAVPAVGTAGPTEGPLGHPDIDHLP